MNLTLPVSGAWRTTAIDLGQWLPGGSADGRNRRTSPVAEPLGEGLLTEATAVARPGTRELVFLPLSRHSGKDLEPTGVAGKQPFPRAQRFRHVHEPGIEGPPPLVIKPSS